MGKYENVEDGLGVQNISDLLLKEIYDIYKTKNLTKEQKQERSLSRKWCYDYCY